MWANTLHFLLFPGVKRRYVPSCCHWLFQYSRLIFDLISYIHIHIHTHGLMFIFIIIITTIIMNYQGHRHHHNHHHDHHHDHVSRAGLPYDDSMMMALRRIFCGNLFPCGQVFPRWGWWASWALGLDDIWSNTWLGLEWTIFFFRYPLESDILQPRLMNVSSIPMVDAQIGFFEGTEHRSGCFQGFCEKNDHEF